MTIRTENLTKQFGGLTAVDRVSMEVNDEIVGLMGPNGSGKSTFINCITGVLSPTSGTVYHSEEDITGAKMYEIARRGVARTFQTPHIFGSLTVHENVTVPLLNTDRDREEIEDLAAEYVELVGLDHLIEEEGQALSGGQKKLLEFARCLMRDPDVIFMDEPFAGVHAEIKETMNNRIEELRSDGTDFLIVSHEVNSLYDISDRIDVFNQGRLIVSDTPKEVQNNDQVIEAYLGGGAG
jgi:ABC-type branched-subunit amino acid transport system ATPase component